MKTIKVKEIDSMLSLMEGTDVINSNVVLQKAMIEAIDKLSGGLFARYNKIVLRVNGVVVDEPILHTIPKAEDNRDGVVEEVKKRGRPKGRYVNHRVCDPELYRLLPKELCEKMEKLPNSKDFCDGLSGNDVKTLRVMYANCHYTAGQVSDMLGLNSSGPISRLFKGIAINVRKVSGNGHVELTDNDIKLLSSKHIDGDSIVDIAISMDLSEKTVRSNLGDYNLGENVIAREPIPKKRIAKHRNRRQCSPKLYKLLPKELCEKINTLPASDKFVKSFSDEELKIMRTMYVNCKYTKSDIAKMMRLGSVCTISGLFKGVKTNVRKVSIGGRVTLTKKEENEIEEKYTSGISVAKIAKTMNIKKSRVNYVLGLGRNKKV